jgi:molybdopterin molybdotransferase
MGTMSRDDFTLITPSMAAAVIEGELSVLGTEQRQLEDCIGLTLRQDVYAERDNPPFDRVCMDGIAVDSGALSRGVRRFRIESTQAAGTPAVRLRNTAENAVEIMTGAVLPAGADCVIPMEEYDLRDGVASLKAQARWETYRNVQRRGEDSQPGEPMLVSGVRLGPPEIAIVASAGLASVTVGRQPRLAVISTGDELVEPGRPITEYQVRRSNAYSAVAALRMRGFRDVISDHVPDSEAALSQRLVRHLDERDLLILSGGVARGKFDFVPKVLQRVGVREVFHQVAHRPGAPMWFGVGPRGQVVFGLPGNPVATLVCLIRYVVPAAMGAMGTRRPALVEQIGLGAPVEQPKPVTYFLPVALTAEGGGGSGCSVAQPRPPNGPGDFLALTGTDGFVELPPGPAVFPAGFVAPFYRW